MQFPGHAPPRNRWLVFVVATLVWAALCGALIQVPIVSQNALWFGLASLAGFLFIAMWSATSLAEAKSNFLYMGKGLAIALAAVAALVLLVSL